LIVAEVLALVGGALSMQLNGGDALTIADKAYEWAPEHRDGWRLTGVKARVKAVSSSGNVTLTLKINGTSMLSTNITIEEGEGSSETATTQPVIDTAHNVIETGDEIEAGCSGAGAGVTFCTIYPVFSPPE